MKKMMLCVPDQVREIIHSTNSGYSFDDPKFIGCIALASEAIEKYTRRKFSYGARTDTFDLPANHGGLFRIYTSGIPIDVSSLAVRSGRKTDWSLPDADTRNTILVIDPDFGVLGLDGTGSSKTTMVLSYTAGYKPLAEQPTKWGDGYIFLDVPMDLQMACAVQAGFMMQRFMKNDNGKRGDEGSTVAKESVLNVSPDAGKYLDQYIRQRYAGAR